MTSDSWGTGSGPQKTLDTGVSYEECEKRISKAFAESKYDRVRLVKCLIYAIQLRNAARISEATDALKEFFKGVQEPQVLVRKKKKFKTSWNKDTKEHDFLLDASGKRIPIPPDYRPMLWPEFIDKSKLDGTALAEIVKAITKKQAQDTCRALIGVNSHSLRYARITKLDKEGVSANLISKITHHNQLDFILKYTQQKEADRLNREIK